MEAARYQPHYTIADYERWEGDWELWHGIAVSMSPSPNFRHQAIATRMASNILAQLDAHGDHCPCTVVTEHDWRIDHDTVLRPDVMVVCEPVETEFVEKAPTLIVEVFSPSTALKDRTAKRAKYAQQGVKFYVMVDPESGRVEALALRDGGYDPIAADGEAFRCELHGRCAVELPTVVRA